MTESGTPKPTSDDERIESDPQPQTTVPEEDDPEIKETEEQPS